MTRISGCIAAGAGLALLAAAMKAPAWWGRLVIVGMAAVFFVPGVLLSGGVLTGPRVRFDAAAGVMRIGSGRRAHDWPLGAVACVQICSCYVSGKSGAYTCFELNLVLADGMGHRITLMSHGNEKALRDDARTLAEFLHVPLIENTPRST